MKRSLATLALLVAAVVVLTLWTPGASLAGLLGALTTTALAILAAGSAHHFAHRLIARRPWGPYLYGLILGESYTLAVMGVLTLAMLLQVPGLNRPGRTDPFEDWRHWPVFLGLGAAGGLLWGFLSRDDLA